MAHRASLVAPSALVIAALDLAPSLAHAIEAPPRLHQWSLELWREATVFNGQFAVLGILGGPLEIGTIALTGCYAWMLRGQAGFRPAVAAFAAFLLALVAWVVVVAPANAALATWAPGPVPPDAAAVRLNWESGHILAAAIKLAGFVLLVIASTSRSAAPGDKGVTPGQ